MLAVINGETMQSCGVGYAKLRDKWMSTDFRTPKLGGGKCATESSRIGAEGSKSGGGKEVGRSSSGHYDDIQNNGTEGSR